MLHFVRIQRTIRYIVVLLCIFSGIYEVSAQANFQPGIKLFPLSRNPQLQKKAPSKPLIIQQRITDTLSLPFFEDFSQEIGYPSIDRFTDQQV